MTRTLNRRALLMAPALLLPLPATALSPMPRWRPNRPIRVIVPFAPGGATDVVARVVADTVAGLLGQPLVIENRPGGAAGLIGSEAVAKADPDGHTILVNSNAHVIAPALVARMPYDAIADFAPVAHLGRIPQVLVATPRLPVTDLAGLLAWMRANPGRTSASSAGIGSGNHLAVEVFRAAAGLEMQVVQYRGGGPAMQAVVAGQVQICVDPVASALGHIRGGSVRAIAVAGDARCAALPDVPSASEAGLPAFAAASWIMAFAPVRTPAPAVAAMNAAFNEAMVSLDRRLTELAIERRPELAERSALLDFVREDAARSRAVLARAGVNPE
ncbi:Bug family tripartite tricarboxylate transporter substrate binding protein [Plastoroseomonas arctica]|uniref:Tripartite tricarboxylate transporter substrate binding protein n=1 Tax=Plastoroseomonas arctica TaxID=1509237 RepID=A0AAF1KKH5_9PROT|nr:tripartite tricarboxylate transporter substrate-binding protein [Plastoroseomonas arctica]MBR0656550.1 tripartite tricarboxylate transporter substrate binding protein [Plastoroseomonas arctica]